MNEFEEDRMVKVRASVWQDMEDRIKELEAENKLLREGRVICKSCHKDTAKAESALCYNCRQRPYARIEELEHELTVWKAEINDRPLFNMDH